MLVSQKLRRDLGTVESTKLNHHSSVTNDSVNKLLLFCPEKFFFFQIIKLLSVTNDHLPKSVKVDSKIVKVDSEIVKVDSEIVKVQYFLWISCFP